MHRLLFCGKFSSRWGVFAVVLLWPALLSSQPTWSWAEEGDGGNDQRGFSICTDPSGNNYSTGYFDGNIDFDGNNLSAVNGNDIYLTKYTASGNGIWAVAISGSGDERGYGVTCDATGNVYVCGVFEGAITFYGSPNINLISGGNDDMFVAKFNSSGSVLWAKKGGSLNNDQATAICTDGTQVFITGSFSGIASFGLLPSFISSGGTDVFVAAYLCSTGTEQWSVKGGTTANDEGEGIAVDTSGVYVAGYYGNGTCSFENQAGSLSSNGSTDVFIVKYDLTGNTGLWQRRAGSSSNDEGTCVSVNGSNVYVGGFFAGTMSLYNGGPAVATITAAASTDGFIAQYDATSGDYSWVRSENGTGDDRIYDISTSPGGNVYATGYWQGTLPFGSGPSVNTSDKDVFVTARTSAGAFAYGGRATGDEDDLGYGIATFNEEVYITGYYESSDLTFGATAPMNSSVEAVFLAKLLCGVSTPNAGSNQTICSASATLSGNNPTYGSGTWTLISGAGTITTPTSPASGITALGVGANVFRWTISNGICDDFNEVTITRQANPTTSNAGPNQSACVFSATLAGNAPAIGTGVWTLISGTGTITTPTSQSSAVTGISVGTSIFQWTISNGVCPNSTDQVSITVDPNPTDADAGPDQTICSSTSTLAGNAPAIGTGLWTLISGTGTITTPTSPTSGVAGLTVGTNVFEWTTSNGTCPSSSDQVTIVVDPNPTVATAGPNQTICSSTTTLGGNSPSIGTGVWTLISGSGTVTTPTSPTSGITGLTVGTNIFQWTISNGTCPSSTDQVSITVDPNPTVADAGPDQTICSSTSALGGNIPSIGTGVWTLISGTGTITTPTSPTSGVAGLTVGTNIFEWTISNGTCPSSSDQVTIVVDPYPTVATAGPNQTICSSTTTLGGNSPSIGTGVWTLISGSGTVTTPTSSTSGITGLTVGTNIFQWTISNGTCPSSTDQVSITVDPNPTVADAGPDQTICSSTSALGGNTPSIGTGVWTLISGTGTITTPTSPTSGVAGLTVGTNIFEWTISNGTCPSSSDQVTIVVDPNPTVATAGPNQTICSSISALAGNAPSTGTGLWTLIAGSGTIADSSSAGSTVTSLGTGTNIFQWTISSGVCPSSIDQVTINVDEMPTPANAGSDQTFCSSFNTLNGNTPLVGSGTWSVVAGGGTFTNPNSPTTGVTAIPLGVNIFEWTISNGVCPVSADTVVMTVDAQPSTANAGIDHQVCSTSDTLIANVPLIGTGTWTLVSGSGTIVNPSWTSTGITALGVGVNVFAWTISNGTCPSSSDQLTVTRDDFPTLASAGADKNSCSTVDSLSGNVPIIGTGTWTVLTGSATVANPSSPFTSVSNMSIGTNEFLWTISNGVCPSRYDTMLITYNQPPSAASAGADIFACDEQITMQAQVPSVGTGIWVPINGSPLISDSSNPNAVVPLLPAGTWNYVWTTQNGFCVSLPDTIAITVYSPPDSAICGNDLVIYNPDVMLSATAINTGVGTWTFVQGSGNIEDIHDPFTRVTNLSVGVNILRWTTSNGVCPESSDDMRIEVLTLIIPEGFSPNGDGVNDQFEIAGLTEFENVSLEVFNRWGNVVYTSAQYRNDWSGSGESGEVLPDDVYYFVLKADTETVFTGFIVVKRNVQ